MHTRETRNVFKKTGRKIERNANWFLAFNASFFIYKVKRASLSIIYYDSVSGFQQRKIVDTDTALQIKIE